MFEFIIFGMQSCSNCSTLSMSCILSFHVCTLTRNVGNASCFLLDSTYFFASKKFFEVFLNSCCSSRSFVLDSTYFFASKKFFEVFLNSCCSSRSFVLDSTYFFASEKSSDEFLNSCCISRSFSFGSLNCTSDDACYFAFYNVLDLASLSVS